MYNAKDFIRRALSHAKRESIPEGALLPVKTEECGTEKWEYLYGSVRVQTNKDTIDRYFTDHYAKSMTREKYDSYTKDWPKDGYATDCQGLLDAYVTYDLGEKTDINADMNYKYWCTDKGEIKSISRDFVLGEAVFMKNESTGKMNHVGWVCGFMPSGEPLIVEARGIAYGVVVTRFNSRAWTHRGLMKAKFDYENAPGFAELSAESAESGDNGSKPAAPKAGCAEVCAIIGDFILESGRYSLAIVKSDRKEPV